MKQISELAECISSNNLISPFLLPNLRLAVLRDQIHSPIVDSILKDLQCWEIISPEKLNLNANKAYRSFRGSAKVKDLQLHVLSSIDDDEIVEDNEFRIRKQLLIQLKRMPHSIFIRFRSSKESEIIDREQTLQLLRVDSSNTRELVVSNSQELLLQAVKRYESNNRFELMQCLGALRQLERSERRTGSRDEQWTSVYRGQTDALGYAFKMGNRSKQHLVCSLEGYYCSENQNFPQHASVHWQIMELLEDLWKIQGEQLLQKADSMPLAYVGQCLKMSDYHSLGGFLPEACFRRVFLPILKSFAQQVLQCLEAAKFKIIQSLQETYSYYFDRTNIKQFIIEKECTNAQSLCNLFLSQTKTTLQSQVSYVYAPTQAFWDLRSINSGLYSPEQQVNIQVKYIGRIYVKRVYESIRESVPRLLGHGLLRRLSRHFSQNSLNNLLEILRQKTFEVILSASQIHAIQQRRRKIIQCDSLIKYFSLKVTSTYLVKNLLDKQELRWRQMYGKAIQHQEKQFFKVQGSLGFVAWMKGLFVKKQLRKDQRPNSTEKRKNEIVQQKVQIDLKLPESQVSQKTWIIVLNSSKRLQEYRLVAASYEGFPVKLRPAIWYYLARNGYKEQGRTIKLVDILQRKIVNDQIARQIQKDLGRTPPPELFQKGRMRLALKRVLQGYSLIDQEVGYTQGMNFVAAIILNTLSHWEIKDDYLSEKAANPNWEDMEERAFTILRFIMKGRGLRKLMLVEREYIAQICFRVDAKIKQLNEEVWNMISRSGFTCQIIFSSSLLSVLGSCRVPLPLHRRIIDVLMVRGFEALHLILAGVAALSGQRLRKLKNEQVYDYLRNKVFEDIYNTRGQKFMTQVFQNM